MNQTVYNNITNNDSSLSQKLLLYLIWPFGAWVYSVLHAKEKSSYVIFFLFSMLLCWHMSPLEMNVAYDDFLGIMERFGNTHISTQEITTQINDFFLMSRDAPKDLYENVLIWFTKLFTDNYHFFFGVASIPVAFCQLKSLKYITDDSRYRQGTLMAFLIIALFIFPRDIITTQNPRFATGFWYCVFMTVCLFCTPRRNPIYFLLLFLAPCFHSGMWVYVGIVVLSMTSMFINIKQLESLALISIVFSLFDAELFTNINSNILPEYLQSWVDLYFSDEARARFIEHKSASGFWWVALIFGYLLKFGYIFLTVQMIRFKDYSKKNNLRIYKFYLFIFIVINLIQFIPELNTRYYNFTKVFSVFVWFKLLYGNKNQEWALKYVAVISLWPALFRYGYIFGGALSVNTPPDIFFAPLPYLIGKGWLW